MLLAGLTLLPALLAILGRAVFWPSKPRAGQAHTGWWGRVAGRVVAKPVPTLAAGVIIFGVLACGVFFYTPAGFGGAISRARRIAAPRRATRSSARDFPQASANPTNLVFQYPNSVWTDPAPMLQAQQQLRVFVVVRQGGRPAQPQWRASDRRAEFDAASTTCLGAPKFASCPAT